MYNPWLAFAVTLVVLGLVSTRLFQAADQPPTDAGDRVSTLDGLRGFAALGVFFHHALIMHDFLADGMWRLPPSRFFSMVGQVGVSIFFLITGYLFWSKLLRERGRPNWIALYVGRVFRIGPVYALMLVWVLLAVVLAGQGRSEDASRIAGEVAKWLSLGMFSAVPIDGDPRSNLYVAGVVWSLQYEWTFYAALLPLSLGARKGRWALPFTVALGLSCAAWRSLGGPHWLSEADPVFAMLFAGGMVCASLEASGLTLHAAPRSLSAGCLTATAATFILFPTAYALLPTLLIAIAFFLVLSGGDVFKLLSSRAARRLGDVSFGMYLLQGLVLTVAFYPQAVRDHALASVPAYWTVVLAAAVALLVLATAAHRWLERPGVRGGRQFIHLVSRGRSTRSVEPADPGSVRI